MQGCHRDIGSEVFSVPRQLCDGQVELLFKRTVFHILLSGTANDSIISITMKKQKICTIKKQKNMYVTTYIMTIYQP